MAETEVHFSIVVLCYRGGKAVIPLVEKLHGLLASLEKEWEIVLVGNYLPGIEDETPEVVRGLAQRLPRVRSLTLPKEGMAGWDLRRGLEICKGRYLGFIDGDGQMPPESVLECLKKIEAEGLDFVKTYRISREDGLYRKFVSSAYNCLFQWMFHLGVRDVNSNPKLFLATKYRLLDLVSDDWFIDAEMVIKAKKLGFRMGEVPMRFYELQGRRSFVKVGTLWEFLRNMWSYRFGKHSG